jgi:hypothetical protein
MCLVFSHARVTSPSHRTRAAHRADCRSDPRVTVRASVEKPQYHDDIFTVSTPSQSSTYLWTLPFLVLTMQSRPTIATPPTMDTVASEH